MYNVNVYTCSSTVCKGAYCVPLYTYIHVYVHVHVHASLCARDSTVVSSTYACFTVAVYTRDFMMFLLMYMYMYMYMYMQTVH